MKIRSKTSITVGLRALCAWFLLSSTIAFADQCAMDLSGVGNYYVCRTDPINSKLSIWVNVDEVRQELDPHISVATPNSSACSSTSNVITNYQQELTQGANAPINSTTTYQLTNPILFNPTSSQAADGGACFHKKTSGLWTKNV
jgi:hypothetical protein